jgi:hypothetical protein
LALLLQAHITTKDPAGNQAIKKDVRVFMVDDIPPALSNVPLVSASLLIPGASSPPSITKFLKRDGPIPVLQRDGRKRVTKIEVSKVTKAQLAALNGTDKVSSIDDHPCHEDKVTFKEIKDVKLAELNKALADAYVAPAERKRVVDFHTVNSAIESGSLVLRTWSIKDPAGNSDSVLQLLAVNG